MERRILENLSGLDSEGRLFEQGGINVQAVLAIPGLETLRNYGDAAEVLMQKVAGVPLLIRVVATAARAGVNSVLVIWPEGVNSAILESCAESSLLKNIQVDHLVWPSTFDPQSPAHWAAIWGRLEDRFLWLPWNWVTHKRALARLTPASVLPSTWDYPALLEKRVPFHRVGFRICSGSQTDGVPVTFRATARIAERFLVANSGKPLDGIYSTFNRRLCRPFVRLLTDTRVTPNVVTLAGLLVAMLGALLFARGSYVNYVGGALLFFVSGLFDEMDGMLARIKFRESAFGTWFEGFVDNVTYLAIFAGITVGLHRQYGSWALKYGIALTIGCLLSVIVISVQRRLSTAPDRPHEYAGRMNQLLEADSSSPVSKIVRHIHIFVKKGVLVHYLLIFTLVGGLPLFLWLAAVGSNLTWILALYFTRRFFRRLPLEAAREDVQTAA
jgi:phosphatidylglycerophosphate synthase